MEQNNNTDWLDFLSKLDNKSYTKTSTSIKVTKRTFDQPLIDIPLDKLFEFYGNLILAGFSEDEALIITVGIANNARN